MTESKEKRVQIKEADSVVVREMLRYFYTQEVQNMNSVVTELYKLADRYLVEDLKNLCISSLIQMISKGNALELYSFGRINEIQNLTEAAKQVLIL